MRRFVVLLATSLLAAHSSAQAPTSLPDSTFARIVATFSEPSGFFDTDNLISNEDSYLHPVGTLKRLGVTGGAYIGVGPDQNFSYIAAIRPRVAFIIDIRRDNLLEHVLFKSIFALSRNRLEYVCLLFGKTAPADTAGWGARDISALLGYILGARDDSAGGARSLRRVLERARRSPLALSANDLATIERFHRTFLSEGPALRFNSLGRAPQPYYPDYRRLLVETDLTGRQSSFLAHEADFQVVKSLEDRNLLVPIVGDFGGDKAIAAVGQWLAAHQETVSAFYTSNVEQYLFADGKFSRFARSVAQLPRDPRGVIIRSYFQGGHPQAVAGYHATQVMQQLSRFVAVNSAGGFASYFDLLRREILPP